jgi:hypothetical protein
MTTASLTRESRLTCPECQHSKTEEMPLDSCLFFYECENCHALLRPKAGDCCVFCSYGSVKCPPIQVHGGCCGSEEAELAQGCKRRSAS